MISSRSAAPRQPPKVPDLPFVLDASAVIALLRGEDGDEVVEDLLNSVDTPTPTAGLLSSVNLVEVHQQLGSHLPEGFLGPPPAVVIVQPFSAEEAYVAAEMRPTTQHLGLSLADRACLALGKTTGAAVVTADRAWLQADVGVPIRLIR